MGRMTDTPSPTLIRAPIDVRWRDLDAFNHVNNATYLTYLEESRLQWLKQVPGTWYGEHCMPLLVASHLNYRQPIAWPAAIVTELSCERIGDSSLTFAHRIVKADDDTHLYCDGNVVLVWADPTSGEPVSVPQAIRDAVAPAAT